MTYDKTDLERGTEPVDLPDQHQHQDSEEVDEQPQDGVASTREDGAASAPDERRYLAEAGMATAEYAIGTVAAAAFAGLLLVILRGDQVRAALEGIITQALSIG